MYAAREQLHDAQQQLSMVRAEFDAVLEAREAVRSDSQAEASQLRIGLQSKAEVRGPHSQCQQGSPPAPAQARWSTIRQAHGRRAWHSTPC
jgi:hypothetical protein